MRKIYLPVLAATLLIGAGPGGSDRELGSYAVRLRVTPAPGGGIQRVALPAAAIVALRNRDGTDVRVFDARGRAVPIARTAPAVQLRRDVLTPLPILGGGDIRTGARVSVRLDDRGRARVAEVESGDATRGLAVALGALLDARAVTGTAERLDFGADIPAGRPIRFTVEASRDLENWRPLGERIRYRAPGAAPFDAQVPLGSAPLGRDYLRVTWRSTAPVTLHTATLVSSAGGLPITVTTRAPVLLDDGAVEFVAPATPLSSLRVVPAGHDGAIAIRVLGRDEPEQPWTPLAASVVMADGPALALRASPRVIRIEADRRGAGFSAPPMLHLGFAPRALAFAASGPAPFTLATGHERAGDVFLPPADLSRTGDLPQARVVDGPTAPTLALSAPDDNRRSQRQALLWAVLLAAVGLLGGLVWWSTRRPVSAP